MNKYRAIKTTIDGITFDSKAEARRYAELKLMEKGAAIRALECQPKFMLQQSFRYEGRSYPAVYYIADFVYIDPTKNRPIVEDVKGVKSDYYMLKKKLFLYRYGDEYEFREVTK